MDEGGNDYTLRSDYDEKVKEINNMPLPVCERIDSERSNLN